MKQLTDAQIEALTFSYAQGLKAYGLQNPCHRFWNDGEEQGRSAADILRNRLKVLATYATGMMSFSEVLYALKEVAEEFEEEIAL